MSQILQDVANINDQPNKICTYESWAKYNRTNIYQFIDITTSQKLRLECVLTLKLVTCDPLCDDLYNNKTKQNMLRKEKENQMNTITWTRF